MKHQIDTRAQSGPQEAIAGRETSADGIMRQRTIRPAVLVA